MKLVFCIITLLLYSTANGESTPEQGYYTGAIVEYAPVPMNTSESPVDNMRRNLDEYLILIQKAKEQEADIVVFPEVGLIGRMLPTNKADLLPYTVVMPDPKERIVVPCGNNRWANVLVRLSCAAKENKIYVVANTPEKKITKTTVDGEEYVIYNTNIVFDRTGAFVAKYRKQNIYVEPAINRSDSQDYTTFETDFGVTFGTFICFDILFANPGLKMLRENQNINDIVFLTSWFAELPFITAVQVQAGWARANGVNLLAANYNNPDRSKGGSGIYRADGDYSYSVPVIQHTTMIVKQIKKIKKRDIRDSFDSNTAKVIKENKISGSLGNMRTIKENITTYTTVLINDTNIDEQIICHGSFCCTFTVKFTPTKNADYYYRLIVYDGQREKPTTLKTKTADVQICGLAACMTTSPESCGERNDNLKNPLVFKEISITGNFRKTINSNIIPTNTLYDLSILKPSDFEYRVSGSGNDKTIEMRTTQEVKQILAFGIYGLGKTPEASSSFVAVFSLIIVSIVTLLLICKNMLVDTSN